MVEVFSLMPELDMMVKNELPPKKYECQAFTEFVYRLGISIRYGPYQHFIRFSLAYAVGLNKFCIPMTDNLLKKNYQKCLIESIAMKMVTCSRKILFISWSKSSD